MSTILAADGMRIHVEHVPVSCGGAASPRLAVVVGHGFTGSTARPNVRAVMGWFARDVGVIGLDFRGHGRSGGVTTVGDREIYDLDTAVRWARSLGYLRVATVGFSMGGAVAVRHAGVLGGVDAVVSVSAPASWYYRETVPMKRMHWLVETPSGRLVSRLWRRTRVDRAGWVTTPVAPYEAAARISPTPLLVVHGDRDPFFPISHAERLIDAAAEPKELWIRAGFGHAEGGADADLIGDISRWLRSRLAAASYATTPRHGVG